jgi:hypothetical protein
MGPIYLPFDIFSESSLAPPIPPLFISGGGSGQFVLYGSSQFILGSSWLRGDWRMICEP